MGKSNSHISKGIEYITKYVPYKPSGALYFKKYSYSIVFNRITRFDITTSKKRKRDVDRDTVLMEKYFIDCKCTENILNALGINFRTRRAKNFTFFLNDLSAVKKIVRLYSDSIINVSGPMNESHLSCMSNDTKILVRNKLLFGKYRYKLSYKATSTFETDVLPRAIDFKESMEDEDDILFNPVIGRMIKKDETIIIKSYYGGSSMTVRKHAPVRPWEVCSIYFVSEESYVMFKMMIQASVFGDWQIVTHSELK